MKSEVIIKPALGIEWMLGRITLGEHKNELNISQLPAEESGKSLYFYNGDVRVDFDENEMVQFIEIRGGRVSALCPVLHKMPLFEMEVTEIIKLLKESYIVDERENGHICVLPELDVALWRERTEADVDGFIEDMKKDGIAVEGNADVETERKLAKYFCTVSIGKKGYFAR